MDLKKAVHEACVVMLEEKISEFLNEIKSLNQSAFHETKRSMGDKYETGREMIMHERHKLDDQLSQLRKQQAILHSINIRIHHTRVKTGSLIQAQNGLFYMSIPLGELKFGNEKIFVVSPLAPLSVAMMGLKEGSTFNLNGKNFDIEKIV